jgi:hypothetical protein
MLDITNSKLARVIYEERVNEYALRRVEKTENALALAISAITNALFGNFGRNGSAKRAAKNGKLATR